MPQLPNTLLSDKHADQDFNKLVAFAKSLRPMRGNGISTNHSIYGVSRKAGRPKRVAVSGTFQGEYDSTLAYRAGDTFIIAEDTTIDSIAVAAGFYGVPPAGEDSIGTWAGFVPANPTGNAVPQHPLPSVGAAPNDKFYARMILAYC